ncbi:hypothetical protein ACW9UR_12590 [Halovulum sp. GXIMD14794]
MRVLRNLPRLMLDDLKRAPDHVRRPCEAALAVFSAQADRIESALRRSEEALLSGERHVHPPDLSELAAQVCTARSLKRDHPIGCMVEAPNARISIHWFTALIEGLIDLGAERLVGRADQGFALRVFSGPDALRLSLLENGGTAPCANEFIGPEAGLAAAHLWWLANTLNADLELGPGPGGAGNRVTISLRLDARGSAIGNGQPETAAI